MKLSILICSLMTRGTMCRALLDELNSQIGGHPVEVLTLTDQGFKQGGMTRGAKRQRLLEEAQGDFIVFKDDDDPCPPNYIDRIIPHCVDGVDCIGHLFHCYGYANDRNKLEVASVSNKYRTWAENVDGFRYVRSPHHLVPVRREHALKAGFDTKKDVGEDYDYSMRLVELGLLKNEVFIEEPLYVIEHNPTKKPGT